jgi:hypothetical protein
MDLTPFQKKMIEILKAEGHHALHLDQIAYRAGGYHLKLAVYSSLWSLRKRGLADYFRSSPDRWGVQKWFLTGQEQDGEADA